MNSAYTVHNSKICPPKSKNAGKKKKKAAENVKGKRGRGAQTPPQSPHMIYLVGGILDKGGPSQFRSNLIELVPVRLSHNPNKYRPYLKLSPHQFRI